MAVIVFQIALFFFITYIGYVNRLRLNIVTAVAIIFTIFMVKTNPLMCLQFLTIILAYIFVNRKGTLEDKQKEVNEYNENRKDQLSAKFSSASTSATNKRRKIPTLNKLK